MPGRLNGNLFCKDILCRAGLLKARLQPDLKIVEAIRSSLTESLGATTYEVIASHVKSSTGIDFSSPETVAGKVNALEDYLLHTFRDGAPLLMERMGSTLMAAFSLPYGDFQYSRAGDLARLVEGLARRSRSLKAIDSARDRDHFVVSYARAEEFPCLLAAFLRRGSLNGCLNVLIISEDEKRRLASFLSSGERLGEFPVSPDGVFIVTHAELYGNLDSSPSSPPHILSFRPILDALKQAGRDAAERKLSGLNVVGTFAGMLFGKGKFAECLQIEKKWHETILQFPMPVTVMCPYEKPIEDVHQAPLISCHSGGLHLV